MSACRSVQRPKWMLLLVLAKAALTQSAVDHKELQTEGSANMITAPDGGFQDDGPHIAGALLSPCAEFSTTAATAALC